LIGYLRGRVRINSADHAENAIVLDVSGVGYELNCSLNTLDELLQQSEDVEVFVQTMLREDSLNLFGFSTQLEKRMFNSLLKVNGVGPKMAIKILSAARMDDLAQMIEAGDVKALSNLPKVGKKTAEQLILSLKGKLVLASDATAQDPKSQGKGKPVLQARFNGTRADILSALVNLGFRLQDAEKVVGDLPNEIELQQGIRQGLQALSGSF
jgi:Holliday junction DNA helicase RuvA